MNATLLDAGSPDTMYPLTCTRCLADCTAVNTRLADLQLARLAAAGFVADRHEPAKLQLVVRGDSWISDALLVELRKQQHEVLVVDSAGAVLAWVGTELNPPETAGRIGADDETFRIAHPWNLLRLNELLAGRLPQAGVKDMAGVHIDGVLFIGEGTRLLPGVYIEGTVLIGRNCKIGPNCYIRGSTSIGDGCHVGQAVEIKNSILMRGASIGHLSYCGDSIIGERVNFGAGTVTANFRHDGRSHRSMVGDVLMDTGRRKFGTIIGDDVHTGIHTSIYPGRKIWPHQMTRPGDVVQRDLNGAETVPRDARQNV